MSAALRANAMLGFGALGASGFADAGRVDVARSFIFSYFLSKS
jgi:hypothetical protein